MRQAAALLNKMRDVGGIAGITADDAITKLQVPGIHKNKWTSS